MTPQTASGKALSKRLDEIAAKPFSGVSFPWADDDIADAEKEAAAAALDRVREAVEKAGFEPPSNVCAACGHHGGDHDLGNWCLVCPRPEWDMTAKSPTGARVDAGWCYFASMTNDERWEHGFRAVLAILADTKP